MCFRAATGAALFLAAVAAAPSSRAAEAVVVVQRAALAGQRHYEVGAVWPNIGVGDRLQLVREPDNPHDASAVRVEWRGRKLGYLPRRDNAAAARQLDHGAPLEGRVIELRQNRNRSLRMEFDIVAPLAPP